MSKLSKVLQKVRASSLCLAAVALFMSVLVAQTIQAKPAAAAACNAYSYGYGARGSCVKIIQFMVGVANAPGHEDPYPDGIYGPQTKRVIEQFQFWNNPSHIDGTPTVNGVVDSYTWSTLCFRTEVFMRSNPGNTNMAVYFFYAGCPQQVNAGGGF